MFELFRIILNNWTRRFHQWKKTKVIIVGASHGGHQSILELLSRYGEDVDITLFEAGDYVSFMSCGMELYLEDQVT
ncbi:MAG: NAD(P)/FAD-dependent oxidoreductase, partial [Enterococcus sp.]|nr:NAD(P)/FAD-dependent oxidoreductase [Enterococcus sp.]